MRPATPSTTSRTRTGASGRPGRLRLSTHRTPMRSEVRAWVERIVAEFAPEVPVLEVGALDVNGTCRDLLPSDGYIGMDMRLGQGVDLLADILSPPGSLPTDSIPWRAWKPWGTPQSRGLR